MSRIEEFSDTGIYALMRKTTFSMATREASADRRNFAPALSHRLKRTERGVPVACHVQIKRHVGIVRDVKS